MKQIIYSNVFFVWISPSCQTLSKALDISKNTPLTFTGELQSKDEYMSCTIESSRYSQEPEGRKPG